VYEVEEKEDWGKETEEQQIALQEREEEMV